MDLAFDTLRDHYPSANEDDHHEIHIMNADGSCDRRLTNSLSDARFPTWSPDGARLTWSQDGNVSVMNADGSGQIKLGPGNFPAWGS